MATSGREFADIGLTVIDGARPEQNPVNEGGTEKARARAVKIKVLLALSAAVAVAFLAAGGWTVYRNLKQTEVARDWIEHSQEVLFNLQTQQLRVERADYNLQLYSVTGDREKLHAALMPATYLGADMLQLKELVKDNPSQSRHARELGDKEQKLADIIASFAASKTVPDRELLQCRNAINVLQQEEHGLLLERTNESKEKSYESFLLSSGFLGISMLIVVVLFLFLFRDAARRRLDEVRLSAAKAQLEATVHKLTDRARESRLLTNARDELQLCMTSKQAHESVVQHMQMLLPGTSGATLIINNSRRMVEIAATWGETMRLLDGFAPDACCGLRAGKARWRKPGQSELHCMHFLGGPPASYLCVPLAAHGETQGFVFVCANTPESLALAEERTPLIVELTELASLSIASLNLRAKLEGQSIRDGLTGLFNRNFMEIALERELHRAARQGTSVAVMMLDVDHFKLMNDTFGHEAGDIVLREVAECFRNSLRDEDIICRYGGEEFVVIMPDTNAETAARRAETLRRNVSEIRTRYRGESLGSVTISVGIAMYPDAGRDGGNLIQLADGALYRAKHAGRNQVMLGAPNAVGIS